MMPMLTRSLTGLRLRPAEAGDIPLLEALIASSARKLSAGFYSPEQSQAAIDHVFGVDSELVEDRTYLVAMLGDAVVGCGGWSRRRKLFGGDRYAGRTSGMLDPTAEPARIRAFFVDPQAARGGIGSALLRGCEAAAAAAGFRGFSLMATLPGVPFYAHHGYRREAPVELRLGDVSVPFVPMMKRL